MKRQQRWGNRRQAMEKILQQSRRVLPTDLYIKYIIMYMYVQ